MYSCLRGQYGKRCNLSIISKLGKSIVTCMLAVLLMVVLMPMVAKAAETDLITGTLGDNNGFTYTYDKATKTLTVTGEDSGLCVDPNSNLLQSPFYGIDSEIETIIMRDCKMVGSASGLFAGLENLTKIEFNNFDTSQITDMSYMFCECIGLTSLDVSSFDTSRVTNMYGMFAGCIGLTSLDVSGFDTSRVTDMGVVFEECSGLTSLDVSDFNTSQVNYMDYMFSGCSGLTSLDISDFDTSKVEYMNNMFEDCSGLTSLDVSGFDTSKVEYMDDMFNGCSGLTSLDISGFDTSIVTDMEHMLDYCSSLAKLKTPKVMIAGQSIALPVTLYDSDNNATNVLTTEFCNDTLTKTMNPVNPVNPFADVPTDKWYYTYVEYAYKNGLMSGKGTASDGKIIFAPDANITREQFVQVLYNHSNTPAVSIENNFSDVVEGKYYVNAVLWANEKGIASGYQGGRFGVGDMITRQDLAVMLYKYAKLRGYDTTFTQGVLVEYMDDETVKSYAVEALSWAVSQGIISGKGKAGAPASELKLSPADTATRAECATMMSKLIEKNTQ